MNVNQSQQQSSHKQASQNFPDKGRTMNDTKDNMEILNKNTDDADRRKSTEFSKEKSGPGSDKGYDSYQAGKSSFEPQEGRESYHGGGGQHARAMRERGMQNEERDGETGQQSASDVSAAQDQGMNDYQEQGGRIDTRSKKEETALKMDEEEDEAYPEDEQVTE